MGKSKKPPTICLNMIVKNEEHCITDCLRQTVKYIDTYVIVDTGSTDNTPQIIRDFFDEHGIKGEVVTHDFLTCKCHDYKYKFFHFGMNRTYAIEQCYGKSDYIWVMDADDRIRGDFKFTIPEPQVADTYNLVLGSTSFTYTRPLIFRNDPAYKFRFEGPLHEYLTSDRQLKTVVVSGDYYIESGKTGHRSSDPEKYRKDALIFEEVMDPKGSDYLRYLFYCGQSWRDYGDKTRAIKWFEERIRHIGWSEELFCAYWELIKLYEQVKRDWTDIEQLCLKAHQANSGRAETLHYIARHYREAGDYEKGLEYAVKAAAIPYRQEGLFVVKSVYDTDTPFELAECLFELKRFEEALPVYKRVVKNTSNVGGVNIRDRITRCEQIVKSGQQLTCGLFLGQIPVDDVVKTLVTDLRQFYQVVAFTTSNALDCRCLAASKLKSTQLDLLVVYDGLQVPPGAPANRFLMLRKPSFRIQLNGELEVELGDSDVINTMLERFNGVYLISDTESPYQIPVWNRLQPLKRGNKPAITGTGPAKLIKPKAILYLEDGLDSKRREEYLDQLIAYYTGQRQEAVVQEELARLYRLAGRTAALTELVSNVAGKSAYFAIEHAKLLYDSERYEEGYQTACRALQDEGKMGLSESQRAHAEKIRDKFVDHVKSLTAIYPADIIPKLAAKSDQRVKWADDDKPRVMLSVTTCKRLDLFKTTINSFLRCCSDRDLIGYWLCVDDNSSPEDRQQMRELYPFFDIYEKQPEDRGHAKSMNIIYERALKWDYLIHLEDDWHFVETRDYIRESIRILEVNPKYLQVLFNRNTTEIPTYQRPIVGGIVRHNPRHVIHEYYPDDSAGKRMFEMRYNNGPNVAYWPHYSFRPSLTRVSGMREIGRFNESGFFERTYADEATSLGYLMVYLDTFCCIHIGKKTWETGDDVTNAYHLNQVKQFDHEQTSITRVVMTTGHVTPQYARFKEAAKFKYQVFRPKYQPLIRKGEAVTVAETIQHNMYQAFNQLLSEHPNESLTVVTDRVIPDGDFDNLLGQLPAPTAGTITVYLGTDLWNADIFTVGVTRATDPQEYQVTIDSEQLTGVTISGDQLQLNKPVEIQGYTFYPGQDMIGNDLKYVEQDYNQPLAVRLKTLQEDAEQQVADSFNTLGYIKHDTDLTRFAALPFSVSIQDGIYVRKGTA